MSTHEGRERADREAAVELTTDVGFENETVRRFHDLYCQSPKKTWQATRWLGVPVLKCPLDLWIYQEILFNPSSRPDLVIETGSMLGGSAHFLASIQEMIGSGRVITIDIRAFEGREHERPQHPRLTYMTGSSVDPEIVEDVRRTIEPGERVMVILDSKHDSYHVIEELRAYAPMVTDGNYLIVEDTNMNSWIADPRPGPLEALREYLQEDDSFVIDRSMERFLMTWNPNGYLLRTGGNPSGAHGPGVGSG